MALSAPRSSASRSAFAPDGLRRGPAWRCAVSNLQCPGTEGTALHRLSLGPGVRAIERASHGACGARASGQDAQGHWLRGSTMSASQSGQ